MKFHRIHASGHCSSGDLRDIINAVAPKKRIPIHTDEPELFKKTIWKSKIILPVLKKEFRL